MWLCDFNTFMFLHIFACDCKCKQMAENKNAIVLLSAILRCRIWGWLFSACGDVEFGDV